MSNGSYRHAREGSDRAALVIAFLAGTIGSTVLKFAPLPEGYPALFAAIWAVMVILLYAALTQRFSRIRTEPETTGDNCYYLGFVFTLTSLAVTLYQLSAAEAGEEMLQDVISGFGVALASTIVGIALRVWFMRMRNDLVARDREARIELNDAMRIFRENLSHAAGVFKNFSVESVQLMAEERDRMKEVADKLVESHEASMRQGAEVHMNALRETIVSGSEKAADAISSAVERALSSSTEQFADSIRSIREDLAALITRETEAIRTLAASTHAITEGAAGSNARIASIWNQLDGIADRLNGSSKAIEESLGRAASTMEVATGSAAERIEASFGRLAEATKAVKPADQMKRAVQALEKPIAALESAAEAFERPVAAIDEAASGLAQAAAAMERPVLAMERAAAAIEKPAVAIEDAASRLSQVAAALENRPAAVIEESAAALNMAANRIAELADALKAQQTVGAAAAPVVEPALQADVLRANRDDQSGRRQDVTTPPRRIWSWNS